MILQKNWASHFNERNWIDDLREVAEFRNIFAHAFIDYSGDVLQTWKTTGVPFVDFPSGEKRISIFTHADLNDWHGKLGTLISFLSDLESFTGGLTEKTDPDL